MLKKILFTLFFILIVSGSQLGDFNLVNAEDDYKRNGDERGEIELQNTVELDARSPFSFTPGGGGKDWKNIGTFEYKEGVAELAVSGIATVISSRIPYVKTVTAVNLARNIYNYTTDDDNFYITLKEWHQYDGGRIVGVKRESWVYYNEARTDLVRPDLVQYPIRELERY